MLLVKVIIFIIYTKKSDWRTPKGGGQQLCVTNCGTYMLQTALIHLFMKFQRILYHRVSCAVLSIKDMFLW